MATLSSKRRGSKPAGDSTPTHDPNKSVSPVPPVVAKLRERRQALQRSKFNRDVYSIIDAAIELRERIIQFHYYADSFSQDDDPALRIIDDAGIAEPHSAMWFGKDAFAGVTEKFDDIAEAIEDAVQVLCGTLPPPPVADRRAA